MKQMRDGVAAIKAEVDIHVAAALGMLTQEQVDDLVEMGVHRYNHNLETCRSYFPNVVHAQLGGALGHAAHGARVRNGGLLRRHPGPRRDGRAAGRVRGAVGEALDAHEVPLNFLNPRPGTPLGDRPVVEARDALRAIAAFRLAMPRTILRYAGGREIALGELGTRDLSAAL
jgi:biotin synthase